MKTLPHDIAQNWRWRNFSRDELACRHCGDYIHWPDFLDRLQTARTDCGIPFHILSAHRCALHNARVGGAPLSQHLRLAVDIAVTPQTRAPIYRACFQAGFQGFGFYTTFLHIDLGRPRHWFGPGKAKELWRTSLV